MMDKKIFKFLLICLLLLPLGCTKKAAFHSAIYSKHTFNKKERILVITPETPNELESMYKPLLKELFINDGFEVTDDSNQVNSILRFSINDSIHFNYSEIEHQSFGLSNKVFEKPVYDKFEGAKVESQSEKLGRLEVSLYDVSIVVYRNPQLVWRAAITIPIDKMKNNPKATIKKLLKLYGKNKYYYHKFSDNRYFLSSAHS